MSTACRLQQNWYLFHDFLETLLRTLIPLLCIHTGIREIPPLRRPELSSRSCNRVFEPQNSAALAFTPTVFSRGLYDGTFSSLICVVAGRAQPLQHAERSVIQAETTHMSEL